MDKYKTVIISVNANQGTGLWTAISMGFAFVFGFESKAQKNKTAKISSKLKIRLDEQVSKIGGKNLREVRTIWTSKFSATMTAVVDVCDSKENSQEHVDSKENELIKQISALSYQLELAKSEARQSNSELAQLKNKIKKEETSGKKSYADLHKSNMEIMEQLKQEILEEMKKEKSKQSK